jgi:hypothetical protein
MRTRESWNAEYDGEPDADGQWRWAAMSDVLDRLVDAPLTVTVTQLALTAKVCMRPRAYTRFGKLAEANLAVLAQALRERVDAGAPLDDDRPHQMLLPGEWAPSYALHGV